MEKETILGFDVCTLKKEELIKEIFQDFKEEKQNIIVNINPEFTVKNYQNEEWKRICNKQKYQIPDGIGIVWASKKRGGKLQERITGIDLMMDIINQAQNQGGKIFLYGAKEEVIKKAKQELETKYGKNYIVGICNGYEEEEIAIKKIKESNANVLFVGLGSPKQERFLFENCNELKNIKIMMPVGGSFDVISNTMKRAPNWMQKLNIEWLYRLLRQPKRIFRQLALVDFVRLVKREIEE